MAQALKQGKLTIETGRKTFDEEYCKDNPGFIPGDFVLLAVSDNGCGMDKDTLGNLFEPFFTSGAIDLLMTDVLMPEMNGGHLAGRITELYPEIGLLFMFGYTSNVIAHHGVLDDGMAFIQKPFSMAEVMTNPQICFVTAIVTQNLKKVSLLHIDFQGRL